MSSRRSFLRKSGLAALGLGLASGVKARSYTGNPIINADPKALVLSTWNHGIEANEAAWEIIGKGGTALDAVEAGVRVPEADPRNTSVGLGGFPDRDGHVTLDACIMDKDANCGAVTFLEHIVHPISVARKVMEETPHVMLSGKGALKFALQHGFKKENLLTDNAKKAWERWKLEEDYMPEINWENHDTIGMLAIDQQGDIAGACTTSGWGFKVHGRVGDSPIIGAGMFVDNEIGGAVATGHGELVMKTLGSFLIVELMRQGASPQEAVEEGIDRIVRKVKGFESMQVGYLAVDKNSNVGAYSIHKGFNYALYLDQQNHLIDSKSRF